MRLRYYLSVVGMKPVTGRETPAFGGSDENQERGTQSRYPAASNACQLGRVMFPQSWIATLAAAAGALLAAALLHVIASVLTRRCGRRVDADAAQHERRARRWLIDAAHSARLPVALLVWAYAAHFALVQLAGLLIAADVRANAAIPALNWIRGAVTLIALFWLLLRVGRFIEKRLVAQASRTEATADDVLLPLVGKAIRVILPLLAIVLGVPALEVSPQTQELLGHATSMLIIATTAFLLFQAVDAAETFVLSRYRTDVSDNYRARGVHTQVRMLKRVAVVIIGTLTLASMLMAFESVRRFGTTILASAGVAGIVIGFAAQRSIATLLAGFQIALTQPIRIDDVVVVEGEWGRIEEITLTYVVVNIWDKRRLVLPITYFIEKPFQNWTRTTAQILGTVFFYVDYNVPLERVRAEYERIVDGAPLWDRQVCVLQVTDAKERCVELRGLVSAPDSPRAWDLRCYVRERMLVWLAAEYPQALPQTRVRIGPDSTGVESKSLDERVQAAPESSVDAAASDRGKVRAVS